MKKGYATDFPGSKVYFTEADYSAQTLYNITREDFELKIKFWLLFADHVILSAGHMLQSPLTFQWLKDNINEMSELAERLAILPSLREDRENFKEWILEHLEEEQPPFLKFHRNLLLERAAILSNTFSDAITWPPLGESRWFQTAMVNDLITKRSPLRKRMIGISSVAINDLASSIETCKYLTREKLRDLVHKHCPQRERLLLRYGDIFYYFSGAIFKDAFPVINPSAAPLCLEKVSYAAQVANATWQEKDIWYEILNAWGVTSKALQKMPLVEIANIRKDMIGMRVRQTFGKLLEEARRNDIKEQTITFFNNSRNQLLNLLTQEFVVQEERYIRRRKLRGAVEVLSWVTGGLATLLGFLLTGNIVMPTIIGAGSGLLGFLTGKPILDTVEKKIPGTELVIMATRIREDE